MSERTNMLKDLPLECEHCGHEMGTISVEEKDEAIIAMAKISCMDCEEEEEGGDEAE